MKSGKSANRPPQGKPRTNLAAAAKGQTLFSWHSATTHATTDTAAQTSRNAVQTFIIEQLSNGYVKELILATPEL
jgi:hypothetical protein